MDTTKAEAAAYAPEIELLTRARATFMNVPMLHKDEQAIVGAIDRRLRVLLDLETEAK
jgi:chorismate mutase